MLASLDRHTVLWLVGERRGWITTTMTGISALATLGAIWIVTAIALTRRLVPVLLVVAVVETTDLVAGFLRDVIDRPRPFVALSQVPVLGIHPHSASFPSGHAAMGFAAVALLALLLDDGRVLLLLVPAALVGFSRVWLGAHYPSDVFGGAA